MQVKEVGRIIKETAQEWSDDKAARLGAALAYYSVFSIGPLLIIAISIAGFAFGQQAARGEIFTQLRSYLGADGASAVEALVQSAAQPKVGAAATAIGVATLIFGAVGVVVQLKDALNTIWEVAPKPNGGFRRFLKNYVISVAAVMGIGFILTVSLVVSASVAAVGKFLTGFLPLPESVLQLLNQLVSFGVITVLFAMMFKYLPDVKLNWRDVWAGALVTSVLFAIGKFAISMYLGKQGVASTYGAAGSFVALLVWVYYSAQIFFFGAEFTQVWVRHHGREIWPGDDAVPLREAQRINQGLRRGGEVPTEMPVRNPGGYEPSTVH